MSKDKVISSCPVGKDITDYADSLKADLSDVAAIETADATDATTNLALTNEIKSVLNALITALKA